VASAHNATITAVRRRNVLLADMISFLTTGFSFSRLGTSAGFNKGGNLISSAP